MGNLVPILVPISFFAMIFLIVFFILRFNYQTKKAIIENGQNIEFKKRRSPFMEIGMTILGLAIGLAVAVIPQSSSMPEESKGLLVTACILLFSGAGMVLAFFIRRKIEKKQDS